VIYSHGNSTDIGRMFEIFIDLALNLKINFIGYDYSGFGKSNGSPTDINIIDDLKLVYEYVRYQLKYDWNKIILFG
jgi:abhydrolase domain-containing protein 17